MKYAMCMYTEGGIASLQVGRFYRLLSREGEIGTPFPDMLRIVDETGEDFLYPADWFLPVSVPRALPAEVLARFVDFTPSPVTRVARRNSR